MRRVVLVAVVVLAVAGCGARSSAPYTAGATAECLKQAGFKGVTTSRAKIGFIAAFAPNGGLRATSKQGNTVTVAFAADTDGAASTERAFRRQAPPKLRPRMNDITRTDRNAVMVWTTSPKDTEHSALLGCLTS